MAELKAGEVAYVLRNSRSSPLRPEEFKRLQRLFPIALELLSELGAFTLPASTDFVEVIVKRAPPRSLPRTTYATVDLDPEGRAVLSLSASVFKGRNASLVALLAEESMHALCLYIDEQRLPAIRSVAAAHEFLLHRALEKLAETTLKKKAKGARSGRK